MSGKLKDQLLYGLIILSTLITLSVLVFILGFVFVKGASHINVQFLTGHLVEEVYYAQVPTIDNGKTNQLGLELAIKTVESDNKSKDVIYVKSIDSNSKSAQAVDPTGKVKKIIIGDYIAKIGSSKLTEVKTVNEITKEVALYSVEEMNQMINKADGESIRLRVVKPGDGIFELIVTTLILIGLSLAIACPIGILAAIYLVEYAKPGKIVRLIRFATESLAGIPSIIYGLFGMIFFGIFLNLKFSLLSGALTMSIILLPVIIRQTEESLKAVPMNFREGSLGLGATKLQTISKVILPTAIPGIVVAIILSIGRIVGESAALLFTAGTVAQIPKSLLSGGSTLTVNAYITAKETGNIEMACAIGTVVLVMIFILNGLSKIVSRKYSK